MANNIKICNACGTENEEKYEYCKNCGVALKELVSEKPVSFSEQSEESQGKTEYAADYGTAQQTEYTSPPPQSSYAFSETIEGLPFSDYAIFVGKKGDKYMPIFSRLEITGSKISWHWPVAILSFIFGPFGAAIWFFYRKLYKPAFILSVIGAVLMIISAFIVTPNVADISKGITESELYSSILSGELFEKAEEALNRESYLSDLITNAVSLITAVWCGLFTHNIYKKHIHKAITKYRASNPDPRYYQFALSSLGGTSGGMMALGIALFVLLPSIITSAVYLLCFLL